MKKIFFLIFITVSVYAQPELQYYYYNNTSGISYTPVVNIDTSTYPLTPYGNGWLIFNGTGNRQFARTRDIPQAEFIYSVTDSFRITARLKIKNYSKPMWILGKYDGNNGSWILGFNSNSGNTIEFYHTKTGWKNIKVLTSGDTNWYKLDIVGNRIDSTLKLYYNDTLASTTTAFFWASGNVAYSLAIGHASVLADYSDPTTGNSSQATHFFHGYLDYLYIHKWRSGSDSALVYNFNEGVGQNMYDSVSYLLWDRGSPDGTVASNHFTNGWNPGPDSQDVTFSKGTAKSTFNNNTTALGTGLWQWQAANSTFIQPFTNGMTTWMDKLVPTTAFNRVNVTWGTWTHNGDTASDIAQWNGSTWSKIGTNGSLFSGGSVTQVYDYNDTLIAGGSFTNVLTANGDYVLRYYGTRWDTMSVGFGGAVYCFAMFNGKLIAGGAFNASGGTTITSSVAQWNYTGWGAIGTSDIGEVWALEVHNSELYAGTSQGLYKFNGTNWTLLSALSGATIFCLQSFNNQLWYGGTNGTLGHWNGSANSMGTTSGFANHIIEFCTDGTDLYVLGSFYRIIHNSQNTVCNKIARWNKERWSALGYGADLRPEDFAIYDGKLAFTGDFFVVNGVAHNNVTLITIP